MSIMFAGVDPAIDVNAEHHHDIVDGIETGDPDTAAQAVHDHITNVPWKAPPDTGRPQRPVQLPRDSSACRHHRLVDRNQNRPANAH